MNLADYPGCLYVFFEFVAYVANGGTTGHVQLWDLTANAVVYTANVTNTSPTWNSTDISAIWPGGGHMYEVRFWIEAPTLLTDAVNVSSVQLKVQ